MKRLRFLLLDAGPVLKLFELGLWEEFIARCDVSVCRTVVGEAQWASRGSEDVCIDLDAYERDHRIRIEDVPLSRIKAFHDRFDPSYRDRLHDGEKETLAFLCDTSEDWLVCAADGGVFRTLGLLGRGPQGVSLEKVLAEIGLGRRLDWQFTEEFRHRYTVMGQRDAIQGGGLAR
ncbi:MAG TPA: hypothetical protein VLI39_18740 [Sedimentisphaerales bacterium]|nr:hypothetical protein [Sedimentisphaerales bacterium]